MDHQHHYWRQHHRHQQYHRHPVRDNDECYILDCRYYSHQWSVFRVFLANEKIKKIKRICFDTYGTYWCKEQSVILFVDNLWHIGHISSQWHRLCMDTVQLFDYKLYRVNPPDGNYKLEDNWKTKQIEKINRIRSNVDWHFQRGFTISTCNKVQQSVRACVCMCVHVYHHAISDKMISCNILLLVKTDNRRYLFVLVQSRQNIMYLWKG